MSTALGMVQRVQRLLRLPPSSSIANDQHAQLILDFINQVQRMLMPKQAVYDALKVYGEFSTTAGTSLYTISISNGREIDTVRALRIAAAGQIEPLSDEQFRGQKRNGQAQGVPQYYRYYQRARSYVVIEVFPVPDGVYAVEAELLFKPPLLVEDAHVPLLDVDTIVAGAVMLARHEQGENMQVEMSVFRESLAADAGTLNESNWRDAEAV